MRSSKRPKKPRRIFGSIRSQLGLGFGLMLFLASVIAAIGFQSLQSLRTTVQTTLEEANQIRRLSLEIETEFLLARQAESNFLVSWRSLGFEAAQTEYVSANKFHVKQARVKLNEIDKLVQNSSDAELQVILEDTAQLAPLLDSYESAFQAVVAAIEQRAQPDGQESTMVKTLNQLEAITSPLPDPRFLELVLQIRADEQSYLNSGKQQYFDNLRLSLGTFTDLVKNSSQVTLPQEAAPGSATESDPQEEIVQVPISELLGLIGIYQSNLIELVSLEGNIYVNTISFREVTVEISQFTSQILQEGDGGFTRARDQLQAVSDQSRLALLAVSALALGLGSLAAFVLARRIINPLNELSRVAQKLGQGDLRQTVQVKGGDELVTLGESFNKMAGQLADILENLEGHVANRTKALATSNEISRRLSTILDQKQLVVEVEEQVKKAFNYYHAQIYLIDDISKDLIMTSGNGDAGQTMRMRRLKVTKAKGLVNHAAETNTSFLVSNTATDPNWLPNPLLPETKSEIAVPISLGDQVMGVLDVQHNVTDGLKQEDVYLLQSIANQVAVSLRNARSFEETKHRADRESLISAINQKIQGATTVENALQVAVIELGRALETQTSVRLKSGDIGEDHKTPVEGRA